MNLVKAGEDSGGDVIFCDYAAFHEFSYEHCHDVLLTGEIVRRHLFIGGNKWQGAGRGSIGLWAMGQNKLFR